MKNFLIKYGYVNWSMADQCIVSAGNFLLNVILVRSLGIGEYGKYSLVWLLVLLICNIQMSLILIPMMSLGPKQSPDCCHNYYNVVAIHQCIFSVFCFFTIFISFSVLDTINASWNLKQISFVVSVTVVCVQFQEFIRRYLLTKGSFGMALLTDAVRYIGLLIVLLIFEHVSKTNINEVLWIMSSFCLFATCIGCLDCCHFRHNASHHLEILQRNWSFSKWILASNVINFASGNIYLVPLSFLGGKESVGAIRAVLTLTGVFNPLLAGLENFMPRISSLRFKDLGIQGLMTYIRNWCVYGTLILGVIWIIGVYFSDFILKVAYGESYLWLSNLLIVAFIIVIASFVGTPIGIALRTIEKTNIIFKSVVISTILNLIISYPIVLMFDVKGAIWGSLIGKLVLVGFMIYGLIRSNQNITCSIDV